MRLVVEESSWTWDGADGAAFVERIERLLDRLDVACDRGEELAACRALFEQKILGADLGEILWGSDIPMEVQQRISAHFNRMRFWDDEVDDYPGLEATIAGVTVFSPSASFVHAQLGQGQLVACLPLPGMYSGPVPVVASDRAELVYFITDETSHRGFFRAAIAAGNDSKRAGALAAHAFPDTCFLDGVWRGLRDFAGGYARVREPLLRFLGLFDDHGAWVLTDETGRLTQEEPAPGDRRRVGVSNDLIERRFRAWALDTAPEKPNVRDDPRCRRARERTLGGELLYCEWHYKIEPHINRVHFHRPTKASQGRPIVAIFHEHLPLPGD